MRRDWWQKALLKSYWIDYEETFALVAKMDSIRVLLSLAAILDWPLHQLDMKNGFLYVDLGEEVYMKLPHRPQFSLVLRVKCVN